MKSGVKIRRVLKPGGMACINIGDATRNLNESFRLYANHAAVVAAFEKIGVCSITRHPVAQAHQCPDKIHGLRHVAAECLCHIGT